MGFGKALLGVGGVAIAALAGVAILGGGEEPTTVNRVIDGDTIDVHTADGDKRVRLLNIDTPELSRDGRPADCLAEAARDFLADLLPAGTAVRLEYDVEHQDKYGRDLAGVFLDGELVNARIAEEGLAAAMVVGENRKFYPPVQAAVDAAQRARRGIFDVGSECFAADGGPAAPAPAAPAPDTYTGCRAYGGNYALTSVDNQGRPYAKIDCSTKAQIG